MTPLEAKLSAYFLDLAADEFSNHGCNDFRAKDANLSAPEIKELKDLLRQHKFFGNDEVPDTDIFYDWMVMRLMVERLEKQVVVKNGPREYLVDKDLICTQCQSIMTPQDGCLLCLKCGCSKG